MEQDRQVEAVIVMQTQVKVQWSAERVSALMDGQLPGNELEAVIGSSSHDGDGAVGCWQLYHLIGDVLRSPDLAQHGRDHLLPGRVLAAIASESMTPVIEQPVEHSSYVERPAANDGVFRWKMVAGLASFAAVAAVGWSMVSGAGPQSGAGPHLAQNVAPQQGSAQVLAVASPVAPASAAHDPEVGQPVMLRDARLDELLAAHRQATGIATLGGASGFLRNATFEGHGR
ncbi:sigma-E factor negative regulatory protein [Ottowia flava]|uniref:Sigma-E factor negative regulatory protein n=1 Tax=Ottowia flava TaxID=2675430 RepID=A0ABW4KTQ0_9BURK|nr:sigma-E factor negative regulatory protein [Ottowia sp. GY511]